MSLLDFKKKHKYLEYVASNEMNSFSHNVRHSNRIKYKKRKRQKRKKTV
jgi:lipoate synthase